MKTLILLLLLSAPSFKELRLAKKGWRFENRRYVGGVRYYFEFYICGRWNQVGWLNGSMGRFEIDVMKPK